MKQQVTLESKEVRAIIARYMKIPVEQVIPLRYSFAIEGLTATEIEKRIKEG